MITYDYSTLDDESLAELLYLCEDRLELAAVREAARRPSLVPILAQIVMNKQSWLAELPEWWAVVHATYILGYNAGEAVVTPLLTVLRWADAFDCDWVTELLPSIFRRVGPAMIPGLTAITRDPAAGWSARDLAMKGLAAITCDHPDSGEHVFRIIGQRFMDESEDRPVRQFAGQILLDFRRREYHMALLKFAREELALRERDIWYPAGFDPDEVDWILRQPEPELWHYQEDWMRFYEPAEIQRRQKRWARERMNTSRPGPAPKEQPAGGGRVLSFWRKGKKPDPPLAPPSNDPDKPQD